MFGTLMYSMYKNRLFCRGYPRTRRNQHPLSACCFPEHIRLTFLQCTFNSFASRQSLYIGQTLSQLNVLITFKRPTNNLSFSYADFMKPAEWSALTEWEERQQGYRLPKETRLHKASVPLHSCHQMHLQNYCGGRTALRKVSSYTHIY